MMRSDHPFALSTRAECTHHASIIDRTRFPCRVRANAIIPCRHSPSTCKILCSDVQHKTLHVAKLDVYGHRRPRSSHVWGCRTACFLQDLGRFSLMHLSHGIDRFRQGLWQDGQATLK